MKLLTFLGAAKAREVNYVFPEQKEFIAPFLKPEDR